MGKAKFKSVRGSRVMHKDGERRFISPDEISKYQQDGWELGWIPDENDSPYIQHRKEIIWMYKDQMNKHVFLDEVEEHLKNGWKRGFFMSNNSKKYIQQV